MQDISKNISDVPSRLRAEIAKTGLSQAKFAEAIGEDLFRLKNVLSGTMEMPTYMLEKVVKHCGADATWLVTGYQIETGELSLKEKILLSWYRELVINEQDVMLRAIEGLARGEALRSKVAADKTKGRAA